MMGNLLINIFGFVVKDSLNMNKSCLTLGEILILTPAAIHNIHVHVIGGQQRFHYMVMIPTSTIIINLLMYTREVEG